MKEKRDRSGELELLGSIVTPAMATRIKGPSALQRRLIEARESINEANLYLHSVLCQTCLPYRDPGEAREWKRINGDCHLYLFAGHALDPQRNEVIPVGLPFGTKARTILMHVNQRALLGGTRSVEMENSLTGFVERVLKLSSHGRNMRTVRDQLGRLAASNLLLGMRIGDRAVNLKTNILSVFELRADREHKDQGLLWPTTVTLSADYFESLQQHAVPLDEAHIAGLAHSAMALDIYTWLAQRLHRIKPGQPVRISWPALHAQFGGEISRLDNFRDRFRVALKEVLTIYRAARVEEDTAQPPYIEMLGGHPIVRIPPLLGLLLYHSPPPVPPRILPAGGKP